MSLTLKLDDFLADTHWTEDEVFMLVLNSLCTAHWTDEDGAFRTWLNLKDYDGVVGGLAMAMVFFGGLDIEDLCERVRLAAKGCTYKNMTFPYEWKPSRTDQSQVSRG